MRRLYPGLALVALLAGPATTHAGCGGAFCSLNTLWEAQGTWSEPGARLDLRFEYLDQDQPRAGRTNVSVGEIPDHHDEVRTRNRNLIAAVDVSVNSRLGVSVQAPFISRDHRHIHHHMGAQILEQWSFEGLADVRVLGRYAFHTADGLPTGFGVTAGLKLPTGDFEDTNDDGDPAERMLQPGSGTTDVIAGVYYHALLPVETRPMRGFAQIQTQYALAERDDYRPGWQYAFDLGLAQALTDRWTAMVQLNTQVKGRDRGVEAEPGNSGGSFAWLSPGASYALGSDVKLYAFVQLPLYQRVNGVQLVSDAAYVAGVSARF